MTGQKIIKDPKIHAFNKIAEYKTNIQKSVAILYTNNQLSNEN